MWALVESGTVTAVYKNPKGITIGGIQHPRDIFTRWTSVELKAIGIYEYIEVGAKPDNRFYTTGAGSIAVDDDAGTVTKTWAQVDKALADYNQQTTNDDGDEVDAEDENGDPIVISGLKTKAKNQAKSTAGSLLASSDWYAIRAAEGGAAVPSDVATYRAAVRTKSGAIEDAIDGASDMAAFVALHTDTVDAVATVNDWPTVPDVLA